MSLLPPSSVIDASFGIKLVIEENHSPRVREYLGHLLDVPPTLIYVPDLFFTECANILWKLVHREVIPQAIAERDCQVLLKLLLPVTPGTELMARAVTLACTFAIFSLRCHLSRIGRAIACAATHCRQPIGRDIGEQQPSGDRPR